MAKAIPGSTPRTERIERAKARGRLLHLLGKAPVRALAVVNQPRIWILVLMVFIGGLLHYLSSLVPTIQSSPLGEAEVYMHRILLMVPVLYGGFVFGMLTGFIVLATVTLIMLPRDLLIAPNLPEALLETSSIVVVSTLVLLWFSGQRQDKERRDEAVTKLEVARQELASQIDLVVTHERRLATISDVCRVISSSLDLPYVLDQILDKTAEVMKVPAALLFLKDKTGARLDLVAHTGVSESFAASAATVRVGEGFNGRVALTGEPMTVENSLEDPRLDLPIVREEGLRSQLIVPLSSKGLTIGTLCVAVRSSRHFSTEDIELLTALGSQVGIAIDNARLYQEALSMQDKYRDLFENATVAIFVHELGGVVTAANKACANLTGHPQRDLIGMNIRDLFPPPMATALAKLQEKALRGEAITGPHEFRMVRKDLTELVLSVTTRLVSEDGVPKSLQHIAEDITERHRVRDTLNYYVQRVLTAQEDERKRIARELHDDTAQALLLISRRLDVLVSDVRDILLPEAIGHLEEVRSTALTTLTNLRRLTQDLRPRILDDLGLVAALEWLADDLETQCGIKVAVIVDRNQRLLRPEAQLLLFRIAQEALSNVRKHSGASQVSVKLENGIEKTRLTVQDNGKGVQLPANLTDLAATGKLGILGMHERARLLNGSVSISSSSGKGTTVVAELPA